MHPVDRADFGRHFFDRFRIERIAGVGGGETVKATILIARVDTAFVIGTKRDPRAQLGAGYGIKELDLESLGCLDPRDGRGHVFADGGSDLAFAARGSFLLAFLLRGSCGLGGFLRFAFAFTLRLGRRGHDFLRVVRQVGFRERRHASVGQDLETDVLDLHGHGGASVHLKSEEPFKRSSRLVEVVQLHRELAVDLVDEVIALGDNGVFVPLGDVHGDGIAVSREPFLRLRIDDDGLAVLRDDAASALVVDHGVVRGGGVDIALVAADGPRAVFRQFLGPVLDAAVVVAGDLDLHAQLEVLQRAAPPDEELVVGEMLGTLGLAGDGTILDGPEFGIAVPAGEVLAVEKIGETFFGERGQGGQKDRE